MKNEETSKIEALIARACALAVTILNRQDFNGEELGCSQSIVIPSWKVTITVEKMK